MDGKASALGHGASGELQREPVIRLLAQAAANAHEPVGLHGSWRNQEAARTLTSMLPRPDPLARSRSPGLIGPTPCGVPVINTSPGCSV